MKWYELFDSELWFGLFESFASLGPIAGILLVMVEAFLPFLPLSLFVAINVMIFGFWQGYLYSWLGNVFSSILLFFLIRKYWANRFYKKAHKNKKFWDAFSWIKKRGFIAIFLLLSFPFTPSFLICGLCALSGVKSETFVYSIIFGKLLMMFSLSYIGYNIKEFINQPIKSIILITITLCISLFAQMIFKSINKKGDFDSIKKNSKKVIQVYNVI